MKRLWKSVKGLLFCCKQDWGFGVENKSKDTEITDKLVAQNAKIEATNSISINNANVESLTTSSVIADITNIEVDETVDEILNAKNS